MSMHKKERNRGLVFIEMASPEEAATALKSLESYVSTSQSSAFTSLSMDRIIVFYLILSDFMISRSCTLCLLGSFMLQLSQFD